MAFLRERYDGMNYRESESRNNTPMNSKAGTQAAYDPARNAYPDAQRNAAYPDAQRNAAYPDAQRNAAYPDAQRNAAYPDTQRNAAYPDAQRNAAYPDAQRNAAYPDTQRNVYPDAQTNAAYPDAQRNAYQDAQRNAYQDAQRNTYPDAQRNAAYPDAQRNAYHFPNHSNSPNQNWSEGLSEHLKPNIGNTSHPPHNVNPSHPQAENQQNGGLYASVSSFCGSVKKMLTPTPIPQDSLVDFEEGGFERKMIYRQVVQRKTQMPHVVKFDDPKHVICGIACIPKDEKTPAPSIEVVRGGIGHKFIEINLRPTVKGYWACGIEIMGREEK